MNRLFGGTFRRSWTTTFLTSALADLETHQPLSFISYLSLPHIRSSQLAASNEEPEWEEPNLEMRDSKTEQSKQRKEARKNVNEIGDALSANKKERKKRRQRVRE